MSDDASRFVRHDGPVPVLDLSSELTHRPPSAVGTNAYGAAVAAVRAAGWPGVVLPEAQVVGVRVLPVVAFTGVWQRLADRVGPERRLVILEAWEAGASLRALGAKRAPEPPAAPLRVVGFISAAPRWDRALHDVATLGGLGAGLVLRSHRPSDLQLLEADASNMWVVADTDAGMTLCVTGRLGPVSTAYRVPATRLIEEGLFAHALDCGAVTPPSGQVTD